MNKRSAIAVFLTILIIFMPGCENYQSWTVSGSNHPKHESVGETLQFLIGDECNGRLVGTDGNLSTQRFLINSLESFGLEKYNGGTFNDEFSYNYVTIDKIKLELAGKEFILGKDYFVNKISDTDVDLPLALQTKVEENCVVLLDDYGNIDPYLSDEKVKAILVKAHSPVMPFTPGETRISDKTVLYVTEDTCGYLKENAGGAVHLESGYSVAEKRDNNIIGMIKGNNAKKALVLSAHFDHVGSVGGQIFRGAVDNASGTAALLDIARLLSKKVKKGSLDMDIIFAFFNAEEIGKLGSKAFAEKLQGKYGKGNVTDINMDCVGSAEEKPLLICCSNENSREAVRALIERLDGNFIPDVEESPKSSASSSDHVWFENSIYIYTDSDIIHTLKDTIASVNIKAIENISECVAGLVLNFPWDTEAEAIQTKSEKDKLTEEEARKLKPCEYKFISVDGKVEFIESRFSIDTFENLNKYFNNEFDRIPAKLLDGALSNHLSVSFNYAEAIEYEAQELNTIYERSLRYQDISSFVIFADRNLYSPSSTIIKNKYQTTLIGVIKVAYPKEEQDSVLKFYKKDFGPETFDYKGYKMYYKYIEEEGTGDIKCISKNSDDQCVYIYSIRDNTVKTFDKEKITKLIEDYGLLETLEAVEAFMKMPGEIPHDNGKPLQEN